jgi:transcriptional regulator with GAF, ATPase, and Fis domain
MDQGRLERLLSALHRTDSSTSVLHRLCIVCADTTAVDAAGVSHIAAGRHEMVVASDSTAECVEMLQISLAEGPCIEVMASFHPSLEPDLASTRARGRWPNFARAALDQGIAATFAFPLITGGVAIGALDVYSRQTGDLDTDQVEDALILAHLAALAVDRLDAGSAIHGVDLSTEPAEPWAHPGVVHNATGMVSEQLAIDVNEALLRLRSVAFVTERSVADISRDIVARTFRIESWRQSD